VELQDGARRDCESSSPSSSMMSTNVIFFKHLATNASGVFAL